MTDIETWQTIGNDRQWGMTDNRNDRQWEMVDNRN